jgi:hypothetical protein
LKPQDACDALIQKVLSRNLNYQDNVTVLCIGAEADGEAAVTPLPTVLAPGPQLRSWFGWKK